MKTSSTSIGLTLGTEKLLSLFDLSERKESMWQAWSEDKQGVDAKGIRTPYPRCVFLIQICGKTPCFVLSLVLGSDISEENLSFMALVQNYVIL